MFDVPFALPFSPPFPRYNVLTNTTEGFCGNQRMAADLLVYCLEQVTDYDQFERLSHDLMALNGYPNIEPLGGSKDKGRDALHSDKNSDGKTTVFAYSVREDWR